MESDRDISHLVVIGASAGGIEALTALLHTLKPDFPAPIVIAQHLDPSRASFLPDILARHSALPIRTVTEHERLEPGVVFVIPANHHVEISDDAIELHGPANGGPMPSIDMLLQSAAQRFGEGLIAVILTGTGSDGTAGARFVKEAGGTVVIQNPATARYPMMPLSLAPTTVDIVSDLEQIGSILYDLVTGQPVPPRAVEDQTLREFLDWIRDRSGIDFNNYKTPTILRRLQRRLVATGHSRLSDYAAYVEIHPDEYARLVNTFLINVTEFFRDPELFGYLADRVLPELIGRARGREHELRLWSAGCATGEEAYSLAILLAEALGEELGRFNVRIFATDLDEDAIQFARRGLYPQAVLAGVAPERLARFFVRADGAYEVSKPIRSLIIFGQHDLGQRAPFPRIDLVLCRNVLIYFTPELQRRALQLFAFSLRDAGYLVLGKAETVSTASEYFSIEHQQLKIYRRQGDRILIPPGRTGEALSGVPRMPTSRRQPFAIELARVQRENGSNRLAAARSESALLHLPIGVLIVDRHYDIQIINNAARGLLGIHSPAIGEDLIHLVHDTMARPLRGLIDAAFRSQTPNTVHEVMTSDVRGHTRSLDVTGQLQPSAPDEPNGDTVLLLISDVTPLVEQRHALEAETARQRQELEQLHLQLEQITAMNEELIRANEDLATVNTQLRATNEEFLVGNEELQAASEEVETLNEELQATNEELETLNEELQATVEELKTTTDDLQARSSEMAALAAEREVQRAASEEERDKLIAILNHIGTAVAAFDADGAIVMTNAAYDRLFGTAGDQPVLETEDGELLASEDDPRRRIRQEPEFVARFLIRSADGQRRRYEAIAHRVAPADHRLSAILVVREVAD